MFEPGQAYLYTTYDYSLLGAIIESVSGGSFETYMRENIWTPLDMANTSFERKDMDRSNKADLYLKLGLHFIKSPRTNLFVKYAGGGIQSTASDLLKFGQAILDNTLIDSATLDLMIDERYNKKENGLYVFGWHMRKDRRAGRILEHGGSQSGCSSFLRIYLDQKVVSVVLTNSFNSDNEVYLLAKELAEIGCADNIATFKPKFKSKVNASLFSAYAGRYTFKEDVINIFSKDGALYSQKNQYPPLECFPMNDSTYFFRYINHGIEFRDKETLVYHGNSKDTYVKIN